MNHQEIRDLKNYLDVIKARNPDSFITDQVSQDVDLDKVFSKVDLTLSTIGKQYLYECFHKLNDAEEDRFEYINFPISEELKDNLTSLYKVAGYQIYEFFDPSKIKIKKWMEYVMYMPLLLPTFLILSFFYNVFAYFFFIILGLNTVIHLWHKRDSLATNSVLTEIQKMVFSGRKIYRELKSWMSQ